MAKYGRIPWDAISARLRGDIDKGQTEVLDAWLSGNERNIRLYDELEELWNNVRTRGAGLNPDRQRAWNELRKRTVERSKRAKRRRSGLIWVTSALGAAAVALAVTVGFMSARVDRMTDSMNLVDNISGKSRMDMPDGSVIWLHSNTNISYSQLFGHGQRELRLDGEAFFDVAGDEDMPFIVRLGEMDVKVHGTRFNVRSYSESDMISVSLSEGSVSLCVNGEVHYMTPGEIADYDKNSKVLTISQGDIFLESLWASDRLRIENRTLGEICRYLEKWYNAVIDLDPQIADAFSYSFTITGEPLEEILRIMNRINPIDYRFTEGNGVIITQKPNLP